MSDTQKNVSRRDFVKAGAVAGAAVATGLVNVPFVHAAGSGDIIKVGIVGCGGRGTGAGVNVLCSAKNVQIVALADAFKRRTTDARAQLEKEATSGKFSQLIKDLGNSVNVTDDTSYVGLDAYERLIQNKEVNYVILATPPGFRPICIQECVSAKKNFFTEKPVGVDGAGIRKVLDAYETSKKLGLHIAAGTQRRHQFWYMETLKRIHDGDIGDIVNMHCHWNNSHDIWFHPRTGDAPDAMSTYLKVEDTDLAYQLYNWYHFLWMCGDHICEQHVHNLDVCNWAMNGHPVRATGFGGRFYRKGVNPQETGNIWDNFSVIYDYEGAGSNKRNVQMFSTCSMIEGTPSDVSESITGTKGFCQANKYLINGESVTRLRKYTDEENVLANVDPYVQEHTDLIASIRNDKPLNELQNVAFSTLTAILGRMAAYTGKTVTWEQALNTKQDTFPTKLKWDMKIDAEPVPLPGKTPLI
jgi:predicted dehydrogenase